MKVIVYSGRDVPKNLPRSYPYVVLYQDNWDDYTWKCRFIATLHISADREVALGALRIASDGIPFRIKKTSEILTALPERTASLGESIAYYRKLRDLVPEKVRKSYLFTFRDIVAKPSRRSRIKADDLWNKSFMREASSRHAFKRGAFYLGGTPEEVEPPKFKFSMKLPKAAAPHIVDIDFSRFDKLPNRTMLFIGRNGTGKTTALSALAAALMPPQVFTKESLKAQPKAEIAADISLSRVITISYNAFDEFPLPDQPARAPKLAGADYRSRSSYKYCGLRQSDGTINTEEIGKMLAEALEPVASSDREDVLIRVLSTLLDPLTAEALCGSDDDRNQTVSILSAGQRLVTSIFCNIVGFIEEGSLLLIDEPETNLHPGLLTSVIVALNDVLQEYDSYAIIATHSPILLQQIPSRYVRVFTREHNLPRIRKPEYETFGEDLGELSRRALGLADQERDFTFVLRQLYQLHGSATAVERMFPYPLGIPAKAYLYAIEEDERYSRSEV